MNKRELLKFVENLPDSVYVSPTRLEESVKKGTQLDIRITISDSEIQKTKSLKLLLMRGSVNTRKGLSWTSSLGH